MVILFIVESWEDCKEREKKFNHTEERVMSELQREKKKKEEC